MCLISKFSVLNPLLFAENAKRIPDVDSASGHEGAERSKTPVVLKSGDWELKVVPWIGGRIISMDHLPSGNSCFHFQAAYSCWDSSPCHNSDITC